MAEAFIGEIRLFPYTFAPYQWTECNGQLLPVNQNTALFSLLGTTYGGNGQTTFGLPDLRGRFPMSLGQGPGLPNYELGETGGSPTTQLTSNEMPSHIHAATAVTTLNQTTQASATLKGATDGGNATSPAGANLASGTSIYRSSPRTLTDMAATSIAVTQPAYNVNTAVTIGVAGSGLPATTISPFLAMRFCIALAGIYPSRD